MNRGELDVKLQELGITNEMVQASKLPFQEEPEDLVDAGIDYYGRKQKLAACANKAWLEHEGVREKRRARYQNYFGI